MEKQPLIAIDCRFAATHSGLGRYSRELVSHLLQQDVALRFALIVRPAGEDWAKGVARSNKDQVHVLDAPHYSFVGQFALPRLLKRMEADLLFSLHFNAPYFCPIDSVVTIHDLILHRFPNQASLLKQYAYRLLMHRAVKRAKRVIAVSEFVANELRSLYGIGITDRLTVIHEGVSEAFTPRPPAEQQEVRRHYHLPQEFFLYVGNAKQHKHVPVLLEAHRLLGPGCPALVLVCGGREARSLSLHEGVFLLDAVSDADLAALYSAARGLLTASLYEGFGLPLIEALACGCPMITADRGPAREVTMGYATFIDPTPAAFASAMRDAPDRPTHRRVYEWRDMASETARVLREATGS